jgi:hypothetical protein
MDSRYNKMKLLRQFEKHFKIDKLDVDFNKEESKFINMTDEMHHLFKKVFRTSIKQPTKWNDIKKLYIHIIKNITTHDIIKTERITKDNNRRYKYELNKDIIAECVELNKYNSRFNGENFIEWIQAEYNMKNKEEPTINDLLLD